MAPKSPGFKPWSGRSFFRTTESRSVNVKLLLPDKQLQTDPNQNIPRSSRAACGAGGMNCCRFEDAVVGQADCAKAGTGASNDAITKTVRMTALQPRMIPPSVRRPFAVTVTTRVVSGGVDSAHVRWS